MKKIILPLVFIASAFSTLTNAETITNARGEDSPYCYQSSAPVTYVTASAKDGILMLTIGGKGCIVSGLSDARLAMAAAMLTGGYHIRQTVFCRPSVGQHIHFDELNSEKHAILFAGSHVFINSI